jgi:Flp pilus assembly protein TadD
MSVSNSKHVDALFELGTKKLSVRDYRGAEDLFREVLSVRPNMVEAHDRLGFCLRELGRFEDAVGHFRLSATLEPNSAQAHCNLGSALVAQGRLDEAVQSARSAIELKPRYAYAHRVLAHALWLQRDMHEALKHAHRAISLKRNDAESVNILGSILQDLGRIDDAMKCFRRCIALRPNFPVWYTNIGNALTALNRLDEAIAYHQKAQAIDSDFADAHFNEALVQLLAGNLRLGWEKYEWRWKRKEIASAKPNFPQPIWRGDQELNGRTILLHSEQGFGDTLQFVRYAPLVAARGAEVHLLVQRALKSLLSGFPGVKAVYAKDDPLPDFDFHCSLMSLPGAFSTELETIPDTVPYVRATEAKVRNWRSELASIEKLKIGVAWSGNPAIKHDFKRSIPLELFRQILGASECQFYVLQKDFKKTDATLVRTLEGLCDLSPKLDDFSDTAAIMANLDLVISVDTSVAHLAGAMAKPAWILLWYSPEWRWLLGRDDSPWYPTVRLFRQEQIGDWESVLSRVRSEIPIFIAANRASRRIA